MVSSSLRLTFEKELIIAINSVDDNDIRNFYSLELIGNKSNRKYSDYDLLVVVDEEKKDSISQSLDILKNIVKKLKEHHSVLVITDLFFLPLVKTIDKSEQPILHIIIFPTKIYYLETQFYKAYNKYHQVSNRNILNSEEASIYLALSDVLKLWCMEYLNHFTPELNDILSELRHGIVIKWLKTKKLKNKIVSDYLEYFK